MRVEAFQYIDEFKFYIYEIEFEKDPGGSAIL
jgi:hypothetical protein